MNCVRRALRLDLQPARLKQQQEVNNDCAEATDLKTDVSAAAATVVDSSGVGVGATQPSCDAGAHRSGHLTPDLHPNNSPPNFPRKGTLAPICVVGRYILLNQLEERLLYKCVNIDTQEEFNCKIVNNENQQTLAAHYRVDSHEHINEIVEVLVGERQTYLIFDRSYGDLHSYVRARRRLKETEALHLFRQVVSAVQHCHENGIILHDLKLRRFVFKNPERTHLKLETLEDTVMIENDNDDDTLDDKHGCPAYVSPEILMPNGGYSGKAADVWSMGVMLYAMLFGRYPFHDTEHNTLFNKIRGGHYTIPDTVSSKAKCLIRNLLRHNPAERLTAEDVLLHPWFSSPVASRIPESRPPVDSSSSKPDQLVPELVVAKK